MQKMSINQLRQHIENLKKDYNHQLDELSVASTTIYVKEINGKEEALAEVPNYNSELSKAISIGEKLFLAKGALAELNSNATIDVDGKQLSIAGAVALLQVKRKLLEVVDSQLRNSKFSQRRRVDANNTPPYMEIIKVNFERDKLGETRNQLRAEIDAIEAKVDEANNSPREIDIDI